MSLLVTEPLLPLLGVSGPHGASLTIASAWLSLDKQDLRPNALFSRLHVVFRWLSENHMISINLVNLAVATAVT